MASYLPQKVPKSLLPFSDVPNWRTREVGGYIAPGRYPKIQETRPATDYEKFPLSQNVEDRRNEPKGIGDFFAGMTDDPVMRAIVQMVTKGLDLDRPTLQPLHLPLPTEAANSLGASDLYPDMLGFDAYDQWRFDRGLTPGGAVSEKPFVEEEKTMAQKKKRKTIAEGY